MKMPLLIRLDYEYEIECENDLRISDHCCFQGPCSSCWFYAEKAAHEMRWVCVVIM